MTSATPAQPSNWLVLFATLTVQSLVAMTLLTLPVVAPLVAQTMGVSASYVGLYVALVYVGAMTASLISGAGVRRFGAIRLSQMGLGACATGLALCAVPSVPTMTLGALLIGIGYGPITPASSHLLVRTTPAHRLSLVFSLKQTGVPLGGALAGLVVPGLSVLIGWQAAFLAVSVATLLCMVLVQPLCRVLDADREPDQRLSFGAGLATPLRLVLGQRSLRLLALCSFMFSICQLSLTTSLVTWLNHDMAMSLIIAGMVLGASQIAGVCGRMVWGYVSDRFLGAPRMLAVLGALIIFSSLGIAMLGRDASMSLVLVPVVILGASAIGWNGVYLAEVARQAPAGQASVATGGTLAFTFLGVVVGPPLFGLIAGLAGGYGVAYATLVIPGAICLWVMWTRREVFAASPAGAVVGD